MQGTRELINSNDTRIINGITGKRISINIRYFLTFEDLKSFITAKWGIPREQLLILLPYGGRLKSSIFESYLAFDNENSNTSEDNHPHSSGSIQREFVVYDRRLFSSLNLPVALSQTIKSMQSQDDQIEENNANLVPPALLSIISDTRLITELSLIKPVESPLIGLAFGKDDPDLLQNIGTALTTNLGWVSALVIDVHYMEHQIKDLSSDISRIIQCLFTAEQYLKTYSSEVEELYNSNVLFLQQLNKMKTDSKWQDTYDNILSKLDVLEGQRIQQFVDKGKLMNDLQKINNLDSQVNSQLIAVKTDIDKNFDYRGIILENIQATERNFDPHTKDYKLEEAMLVRFNELIDEIKDKSHEFLEEDINDKSDSKNLQAINDSLDGYFKGTVRTLHTISQALYSKVEEFLQLKNELQLNCITILGQVSYSQVSILQVKKSLLNECNSKLKAYQSIITHFTQVEDIPLIYGLHLIEVYRRKVWIKKISAEYYHFMNAAWNASDSELNVRKTWKRFYGVVSDVFDSQENADKQLSQVTSMFLKREQLPDLSTSALPVYEQQINDSYKDVENYVISLKHTSINRDIIQILKERWDEVESFRKACSVQVLGDYGSQGNEIAYYRKRVQKLEDLLHNHMLGDRIGWPFRILPVSQDFNSRDISTITFLSESKPLAHAKSSSAKRIIDVEKTSNKESQEEREILLKTISSHKAQITDLEVEIKTYKETLRHLNNELLTLTTDIEDSKKVHIEKELSSKAQISNLVNENTRLLRDTETLRAQLVTSKDKENEHLKLEKEAQTTWSFKEKELTNKIKDLNEKLDSRDRNIADHYANENAVQVGCQTDDRLEACDSIGIQTDPTDFTPQRAEVPVVNSDLKLSDEEFHYDKSGDGSGTDVHSTQASTDEARDIICELDSSTKDLFNVFRKNIYILENIGLLLTIDKAPKTHDHIDLTYNDILENRLVIRRVKGLKRSTAKSLLQSSSYSSNEDTKRDSIYSIQSPVFKTIDRLYSEITNGKCDEIEKADNQLRCLIEYVYSKELYERSVIRRFSDVEILAKKLSKEVKSNDLTIKSLTDERIAVHDFKVGDMALFLPMKEDALLESIYRIPSLNSSLSSVDLSSPQRSKVITAEDLVKDKPKINDIKRITSATYKRPWAAFTTSDSEMRYFYSGNSSFPVGEWFLGKITSMERCVVSAQQLDDLKHNPYKLCEGTVWFRIDADIVATGYA